VTTETPFVRPKAIDDWLKRYQAFSETEGRLENALVTAAGITLPQVHALLFLAEHGPAKNSDVGRFLRRQAQSMTGLMDRLIARKYVGKKADHKDRRAVVLSITTKGWEKLRAVLPIMEEALDGRRRA
jgi:DNA-binding MarR family transcriptional regulator